MIDTINSIDILDRILDLENYIELGMCIPSEIAHEELNILKDLEAKCTLYNNSFANGVALIKKSHFKEYAKELANDIGLGNRTDWPYNCIDWDKAANALSKDYTEVDYHGEPYYIKHT